MATGKGSFTSETGDYDYKVVQYKMEGNDRIYSGSGYTSSRANSRDLEWVRVQVGNDTGNTVVTVYGPHLPDDLLDDILEAMFDDAEYGEAVG